MSFTGPITRSRSLATAHSELNNTSVKAVGRLSMVESAQPDIADKLSELLKAAERSIKASKQNQETLTEAHELGTRKHTDLIKSQQEQQTQLAKLISQSTLQIGPAIHPTPFYGKPTDDLLSFISHFERFSNFCGWNDDQRLRALPLYLQGNASSWYASFDSETFKSYNDLATALKAHFTNPASIWLWRQQLSARKQEEHESLSNYSSDIRHLCKRLGLTDLDVMHYFIQGLRPDLKSHVILGQPKSLSEAENLANLKQGGCVTTYT